MSLKNIFCGDCENILETMCADGVSVDLTVTSPPYDNLRAYEGENDFTFEKFQRIAKQLFEITKDGGVVIWIVNDSTRDGSESGTSFRQALWFKECGFNLHDTMIFHKENYIPLTHNRYEQAFEYMFCFSKGAPKTFNPIMVKCKNAGKLESYGAKRRRLLDEHQAMRCPEGIEYKATKNVKYHSNVFTYSLGGTRTGHPAVFPEDLAKDQILTWSNKGDAVLDPFMGAGTTGKKALELGRDFYGIEIVPKYFEIAQKRLCVQRKLFL